MAIEGIWELTNVVKLPLQHSSLWELIVDGAPDLKFRVISVQLPFIQFETQTRKTGSKHYTEYKPEEDFTVTFYEVADFSTYEYFKDWQNDIFAFNARVWRTGSAGIRNFTLAFSRDFTFGIVQSIVTGERRFNQAFRFERVKIKGIDTLDLNYDNGDPLQYSVNFIADRVIEVPVAQVRTQRLTSGI